MTEPETAEQSTARPKQPVKEKRDKSPQPPSGPPPDLCSPIVAERQVGRFEFLYRRLPVSARLARVLVTTTGRCVVYRPEKQPTTGELLWGGTRMVYDVDLGVHVTQVVAAPPSQGDKIAFCAVIDLIWRVTDPAKVVLAGVRDVRKAVSPSLLSQLRAVTRQHKIEKPEAAEKAVNEEFRDSDLGADLGLSFKVFVRLSMDKPTLSHAEIQREVEQFRKIIAAGDYNQFALQLALKPADVSAVVQMLVTERDTHRQAVFDFVTKLLESDAINRWEIDDQIRTTLQWLRDSGYKVLSGTDDVRKFSYGENHRTPAITSENGSSPA